MSVVEAALLVACGTAAAIALMFFAEALSGFSFDGADFTVFLSADGLDQLTVKGIAHTAWPADLLA